MPKPIIRINNTEQVMLDLNNHQKTVGDLKQLVAEKYNVDPATVKIKMGSSLVDNTILDDSIVIPYGSRHLFISAEF